MFWVAVSQKVANSSKETVHLTRITKHSASCIFLPLALAVEHLLRSGCGLWFPPRTILWPGLRSVIPKIQLLRPAPCAEEHGTVCANFVLGFQAQVCTNRRRVLAEKFQDTGLSRLQAPLQGLLWHPLSRVVLRHPPPPAPLQSETS
jgi:hypothetical protein